MHVPLRFFTHPGSQDDAEFDVNAAPKSTISDNPDTKRTTRIMVVSPCCRLSIWGTLMA